MTRQVDAAYENGVLRPLEPLPLKEHQNVGVTVCDAEVPPLAPTIGYAFLGSARILEEVRNILSQAFGFLGADIGAQREDRF